MSFEQPKQSSEGREDEEQKVESQSPHDLFEKLVSVQCRYFESVSDEERDAIENEQRKLIDQGRSDADEFLKVAQDQSLSEADRNDAMGKYGYMMDQLAVCVPWSDVKMYGDQYIRDEALLNLQPYFDAHPKAKEVAKWIFYLFHHGAGIDKAMTAEAWERELRDQPVDKEFAREYVKAEENGMVYLEKYLAFEFDKEQFSLEEDYQDLIVIDNERMKTMSPCIRDVANWYGRIAQYQKIAGGYADLERNVERAVELQKKLIAYEPSNAAYRQCLDMIYQEQGIESV